MNTLSWFLYFAEMSESLKIGGALGIAVSACGLVVATMINEKIPPWKYWLPVGLCSLLLIFSPSKNTMYAIAASELGQAAIESRLGQKVEKALENWIDKQLVEK